MTTTTTTTDARPSGVAERTARRGARAAADAVGARWPMIAHAAERAGRRYRLTPADADDVAGETAARLLAAIAETGDAAGVLSPAAIARTALAAASAIRRASAAAAPVGDAVAVGDATHAPRPPDADGETVTHGDGTVIAERTETDADGRDWRVFVLSGDRERARVIGRTVGALRRPPKSVDVYGVADHSRWAMRPTEDRWERERFRESLAAAIGADWHGTTETERDAWASVLQVARETVTAPARRGWRVLSPVGPSDYYVKQDGAWSLHVVGDAPTCAEHGAPCDGTGDACRPPSAQYGRRAWDGRTRSVVTTETETPDGDAADALARGYLPEMLREKRERADAHARRVRDARRAAADAGRPWSDADAPTRERAGDVVKPRRMAWARVVGTDARHAVKRAARRWARAVVGESARWADRLAPTDRVGAPCSVLPAWHPAVTGETPTVRPSADARPLRELRPPMPWAGVPSGARIAPRRIAPAGTPTVFGAVTLVPTEDGRPLADRLAAITTEHARMARSESPFLVGVVDYSPTVARRVARALTVYGIA